MAQVQVPWTYLNQANFPSICVVTGEPTSARGDFFQTPPRSVGKGILGFWIFGLPALVFFAWRNRKSEFPVNLPITRSAWLRIIRIRRIAAVAITFALSTFLVTVTIPWFWAASSWMRPLVLATTAGVLVWAVLTWQMRSIYPRLYGQERVWVTLRPVSDAFANAVSLALAGEARPSPDIASMQNTMTRAYGSGHR
jgi:hypothetical protein